MSNKGLEVAMGDDTGLEMSCVCENGLYSLFYMAMVGQGQNLAVEQRRKGLSNEDLEIALGTDKGFKMSCLFSVAAVCFQLVLYGQQWKGSKCSIRPVLEQVHGCHRSSYGCGR